MSDIKIPGYEYNEREDIYIGQENTLRLIKSTAPSIDEVINFLINFCSDSESKRKEPIGKLVDRDDKSLKILRDSIPLFKEGSYLESYIRYHTTNKENRINILIVDERLCPLNRLNFFMRHETYDSNLIFVQSNGRVENYEREVKDIVTLIHQPVNRNFDSIRDTSLSYLYEICTHSLKRYLSICESDEVISNFFNPPPIKKLLEKLREDQNPGTN